MLLLLLLHILAFLRPASGGPPCLVRGGHHCGNCSSGTPLRRTSWSTRFRLRLRLLLHLSDGDWRRFCCVSCFLTYRYRWRFRVTFLLASGDWWRRHAQIISGGITNKDTCLSGRFRPGGDCLGVVPQLRRSQHNAAQDPRHQATQPRIEKAQESLGNLPKQFKI